jgi:hypothetical protein
VRYRVDGRDVSRTFRTRGDATAFRRQIEHDELRGTAVDPRGGRITLDEWWQLWWPSTASSLRASTHARDDGCYGVRTKATFGDLALNRIRPETIR